MGSEPFRYFIRNEIAVSVEAQIAYSGNNTSNNLKTKLARVMYSSEITYILLCQALDNSGSVIINGPVYTLDGSSVWDERGQRTIARLITRLCMIRASRQIMHPHELSR